MKTLFYFVLIFFANITLSCAQSEIHIHVNNVEYLANLVSIESENEFVIEQDISVHAISTPGGCNAKKQTNTTFLIVCGPTILDPYPPLGYKIICQNTNDDVCAAIPYIMFPR